MSFDLPVHFFSTQQTLRQLGLIQWNCSDIYTVDFTLPKPYATGYV